MGWLKDRLTPALVGLDEIEKANISPYKRLVLLHSWMNPHASYSALKELRRIIKKFGKDN